MCSVFTRGGAFNNYLFTVSEDLPGRTTRNLLSQVFSNFFDEISSRERKRGTKLHKKSRKHEEKSISGEV